jgi:hypothetical protein
VRQLTRDIRSRCRAFSFCEVRSSDSTTAGGTTIVRCFSPYAQPSLKFPPLFTGITARTAAERKQMVRAIGERFASITYEGHVGTVHTHASTVTIHFWYGKQLPRQVTVRFNDSNAVESVQCVDPGSFQPGML